MKILRKISILLAFLTLIVFLLLLVKTVNKYPSNIGSESMMNDDEIRLNEYNKVNEKVKPFIVYANVLIDGKQHVAEVIEDKQNGTTYCVKVDNNLYWLDNEFVTILNDELEEFEALTDQEIELYVNFNMMDSNTEYFLWVDIYRNETYVLKKINDNFNIIKRLSCSTGSIYTPTKRGMFEISNKGEEFLGRDKTYKCYYFMQYSGSYLLHSFPYYLNDEVKDDRLDARVSNGCVRYSLEDSKYLYDLIPIGTTIWLN